MIRPVPPIRPAPGNGGIVPPWLQTPPITTPVLPTPPTPKG